MNPDRVSIIIPALNEATTIGYLVRSIKSFLPKNEIIVVNDGSTDATAQIAIAEGAKVLNHDKCRGYGAGLRTGAEAAKGDYLLFCDGDGQHSAEDVSRLIQECEDHDMVVGARDSKSYVSLIRRPGKAVLRFFANYLAGEKIPDLNSGLRLVKREILMRHLHLMPQGFSFSTTCTFALIKTNRKVKWIPISTHRPEGNSTVRQLTHGPQTILLMLRLTVLFEPLKVFFGVAGFLFVIDVISLFVDIMTGGESGISDTTVLLSIATLLVFLFGLLCDQVSAIRRDIHE